jgi:hypothetical protein
MYLLKFYKSTCNLLSSGIVPDWLSICDFALKNAIKPWYSHKHVNGILIVLAEISLHAL